MIQLIVTLNINNLMKWPWNFLMCCKAHIVVLTLSYFTKNFRSFICWFLQLVCAWNMILSLNRCALIHSFLLQFPLVSIKVTSDLNVYEMETDLTSLFIYWRDDMWRVKNNLRVGNIELFFCISEPLTGTFWLKAWPQKISNLYF